MRREEDAPFSLHGIQIQEGEGLICGRGNLMLIKSEECHILTWWCRSTRSGSGTERGSGNARFSSSLTDGERQSHRTLELKVMVCPELLVKFVFSCGRAGL